MTAPSERCVPAFDPFGEPMGASRTCADNKVLGDARGHGETRWAAIVFWGLALLFVGGRIYLSDQPVPHGAVAVAAPVSAQATSIR